MATNVPDAWMPHYGAYCGYLHRLPCDRCGAQDVEVAHLDAVAGKRLRGQSGVPRMRPRQGAALFCAVPLCAACHREAPDSYHNVGQERFAEAAFGSEAALFSLAIRHQLTFFLGALCASSPT